MKKQQIQDTLIKVIQRGSENELKILWGYARKFGLIKQEDLTEAAKSDMLFRLVYSSARDESCTDEDIAQILAASRKNNEPLEISGLLIHTPTRFLQVLEGKYKNITRLYDKIKKDNRHGGSVLRYCEPASQRFFENWSMAEKQLGATSINILGDTANEDSVLMKQLIEDDLHNYSDESIRSIKAFLSLG